MNELARLLRLPAVMAITALSKSTIYADIKTGHFPRPIAISRRCVAWSAPDIEAWIAGRIAAAGGLK